MKSLRRPVGKGDARNGQRSRWNNLKRQAVAFVELVARWCNLPGRIQASLNRWWWTRWVTAFARFDPENFDVFIERLFKHAWHPPMHDFQRVLNEFNCDDPGGKNIVFKRVTFWKLIFATNGINTYEMLWALAMLNSQYIEVYHVNLNISQSLCDIFHNNTSFLSCEMEIELNSI